MMDIENEAIRGFQAAVAAIRSWADGFYSDTTANNLRAVAIDLESNRDAILAAAALAPPPQT